MAINGACGKETEIPPHHDHSKKDEPQLKNLNHLKGAMLNEKANLERLRGT